MNADMATARWKEMRGDIRQKWGRLSNSDLDQVQGHLNDLVDLVQDRYGYSSRKARREVHRFLDQYGLDTSDMQATTSRLANALGRAMNDYPLAFIAGAMIVALALVGFVWKPFNR